MDEKMNLFVRTELWKNLFPDFYRKRIDPKVTTMLSQSKYRMGLAEVIMRGEYEFELPREVSIPKDSGGMRQIFVGSPLDRCTMAAIAAVYTELYGSRIHPNCVSYQKGISVPSILHSLMPKIKEGGYKVDLSKYFDSVPREVLDKMLKSMDTGSPLDRLLWQFYHDDRIVRDGTVVEHYKSLGQGCAFSPLLANLCLRDVDEELSGMCSVYYRYCDDILMLGPRADEALTRLQERIRELGLTLNPKKVEKIEEGSVFTFLGGRVCRDWVRLSERSMKKNKKAIKSICKSAGVGEKAQAKAVKRLRNYFLKESVDGHCAAEHIFSVCTDDVDVRTLDEYAKDQLKAVLTGRQNHTINERKTSNERLRELGWVSLVSLWKEFKFNPMVFKARVAAVNEKYVRVKECREVEEVYFCCQRANLRAGVVVGQELIKVKRKCRKELPELLEELWPYARLSEKSCAFNTNPQRDRVYSLSELEEIQIALCKMELLIVSSEWVWGDKYFWQSKKYPDLVVFREWFENPEHNY